MTDNERKKYLNDIVNMPLLTNEEMKKIHEELENNPLYFKSSPQFLDSPNDRELADKLERIQYSSGALGMSAEQFKRDAELGIPFSAYSNEDELNKARAEQQSNWAKFGNMLVQAGVGEMLIGTVEGFTDILAGAMNLINGDSWSDDNSIARLSNNIHRAKDKLAENFKIYQENPNGSWNVGDFGWWMQNMVNTATTVSLMLPAMGTTRTIAMLGRIGRNGKTLSALAKWASHGAAKNIAKATSKFASETANSGTGFNALRTLASRTGAIDKRIRGYTEAASNAVFSRTAENYMEGREVYDDVYTNSKDNLENMEDSQFKKFMTNNPEFKNMSKEEIAREIARQAANKTFYNDYAMLINDVLQFKALGSLFGKGLDRASKASERIAAKNARLKFAGASENELIKDNFLNRQLEAIRYAFRSPLSSYETLTIGEGIEEMYQGIYSEKGMEVASKHFDPSFTPRTLDSYLTDGKIWEQGFWGAVGGFLFNKVGGAARNTLETLKAKRSLSEEDYNKWKEANDNLFAGQLNSATALSQKLVEEMKEIEAGKNPYRIVRNKDGGIVIGNNGQPINETLDTEEQKKIAREEAVRRFIDETTLNAKDAGTYDLLREVIGSKEFDKYLTNNGVNITSADKALDEQIKTRMDEVSGIYDNALINTYNLTENTNPFVANAVARNITRNVLRRDDVDLKIANNDRLISEALDKMGITDGTDFSDYYDKQLYNAISKQIQSLDEQINALKIKRDNNEISESAYQQYLADTNRYKRAFINAIAATNQGAFNEVRNLIAEEAPTEDVLKAFDDTYKQFALTTPAVPSADVQTQMRDKVNNTIRRTYINAEIPYSQQEYEAMYNEFSEVMDKNNKKKTDKYIELVKNYLENADDFDAAMKNIMNENTGNAAVDEALHALKYTYIPPQNNFAPAGSETERLLNNILIENAINEVRAKRKKIADMNADAAAKGVTLPPAPKPAAAPATTTSAAKPVAPAKPSPIKPTSAVDDKTKTDASAPSVSSTGSQQQTDTTNIPNAANTANVNDDIKDLKEGDEVDIFTNGNPDGRYKVNKITEDKDTGERTVEFIDSKTNSTAITINSSNSSFWDSRNTHIVKVDADSNSIDNLPVEETKGLQTTPDTAPIVDNTIPVDSTPDVDMTTKELNENAKIALTNESIYSAISIYVSSYIARWGINNSKKVETILEKIKNNNNTEFTDISEVKEVINEITTKLSNHKIKINNVEYDGISENIIKAAICMAFNSYFTLSKNDTKNAEKQNVYKLAMGISKKAIENIENREKENTDKKAATNIVDENVLNEIQDAAIEEFLDNTADKLGQKTNDGKTIISLISLFRYLIYENSITMDLAGNIYNNIYGYIARHSNATSKYKFINFKDAARFTSSDEFFTRLKEFRYVESGRKNMHVSPVEESRRHEDYENALIAVHNGEATAYIRPQYSKDGIMTNLEIYTIYNGEEVKIGILRTVRPDEKANEYVAISHYSGFRNNMTIDGNNTKLDCDFLFEGLINSEDDDFKNLLNALFTYQANSIAASEKVALSQQLTDEDILKIYEQVMTDELAKSIMENPHIKKLLDGGYYKFYEEEKLETIKDKAAALARSINPILFYGVPNKSNNSGMTPLVTSRNDMRNYYLQWKKDVRDNYTHTYELQKAFEEQAKNPDSKKDIKINLNVMTATMLNESKEPVSIGNAGIKTDKHPLVMVAGNGELIDTSGKSHGRISGRGAPIGQYSMGFIVHQEKPDSDDNIPAPPLVAYLKARELKNEAGTDSEAGKYIRALRSELRGIIADRLDGHDYEETASKIKELFGSGGLFYFNNIKVYEDDNKRFINIAYKLSNGTYRNLITFNNVNNEGKDTKTITFYDYSQDSTKPKNIYINKTSDVNNGDNRNTYLNTMNTIFSSIVVNKSIKAMNMTRPDVAGSELARFKHYVKIDSNGKFVVNIGRDSKEHKFKIEKTYDNYAHFIVDVDGFTTNLKAVNGSFTYNVANTDKITINTSIESEVKPAAVSELLYGKDTNGKRKISEDKRIETKKVLKASGVSDEHIKIMSDLNLITKYVYADDRDENDSESFAYFTKTEERNKDNKITRHAGVHITGKGAVSMNNRPNEAKRLIIHENIHRAFSNVKSAERKERIIRELTDLYEYAKRKANENNRTELIKGIFDVIDTNTDNAVKMEEFLTESLSQPVLAKFLNETTYESGAIIVGIKENKKTIFQKIIEKLFELFDLGSKGIKNNSILAKEYLILSDANDGNTGKKGKSTKVTKSNKVAKDDSGQMLIPFDSAQKVPTETPKKDKVSAFPDAKPVTDTNADVKIPGEEKLDEKPKIDIDSIIDFSVDDDDDSDIMLAATEFVDSTVDDDDINISGDKFTDEQKDILDNAPRDKFDRLLAPNGRVSNLDDYQYSMVRTKAFKTWFGDWEKDPKNASKIIDENGEPIVTWHGTINDVLLNDSFLDYAYQTIVVSRSDNKPLVYYRHKGYEITQKQVEEYERGEKIIISRKRPNAIYSSDNRYMSDSYIRGYNEDDIDTINLMQNLEEEYNNLIKKEREAISKGLYGVTYHELIHDEMVKEFGPNYKEGGFDISDLSDNNPTYIVDSAARDNIKFSYGQRHEYVNDNLRIKFDFGRFEYPLFLNLRNPLVVDAEDNNWNRIPFNGDIVNTRDLEVFARDKGYDGVIIKNVKDYGKKTDAHPFGNVFATFSPNNVKSAVKNSTFDSNTGNIYKAATQLVNDDSVRNNEINVFGRELSDEERTIAKNAPKHERGFFLAPNGDISYLSKLQYVTVRTKAFKNWFGDWENNPAEASKAVDENGEPIVTWHTSTETALENDTFRDYDTMKFSSNLELIYNKNLDDFIKQGWIATPEQIDAYHKGETIELTRPNAIYTTDSKEMSNSYSMDERTAAIIEDVESQDESQIERRGLQWEAMEERKYKEISNKLYGYVVPYGYETLSTEAKRIWEEVDKEMKKEYPGGKSEYMHPKPIYDGYSDKILGSEYSLFVNLRNPLIIDADYNNWDEIPFQEKIFTTREIEDYAREHGYDGAIIKNVYDYGAFSGVNPYFLSPNTVYAIFNPSNVKSTDNLEYNPETGNIYKAATELVKDKKNSAVVLTSTEIYATPIANGNTDNAYGVRIMNNVNSFVNSYPTKFRANIQRLIDEHHVEYTCA